ncbi:hypothetical protein L228DRAFT_268914 [Xylona heveae TC161]|uniref:Uncharacterized protein n=1 Tax=Xylona heveae (strain CBS 132557 / TC161) TaxID=1328760 RepID=A0A165GPW8_XYLHT|nr:hypothetical protein L228DRAFT_268914 [Xylona heveae TC161]KZF22450.1 hypothetical protein L228DRAFT_268914 [Xylona heveae TC161]
MPCLAAATAGDMMEMFVGRGEDLAETICGQRRRNPEGSAWWADYSPGAFLKPPVTPPICQKSKQEATTVSSSCRYESQAMPLGNSDAVQRAIRVRPPKPRAKLYAFQRVEPGHQIMLLPTIMADHEPRPDHQPRPAHSTASTDDGTWRQKRRKQNSDGTIPPNAGMKKERMRSPPILLPMELLIQDSLADHLPDPPRPK